MKEAHLVLILLRDRIGWCVQHIRHRRHSRNWVVVGGFFENLVTRGGLEPKWHSHLGNYIVNTLLALHKFQAKKQITMGLNKRFDITDHPYTLEIDRFKGKPLDTNQNQPI